MAVVGALFKIHSHLFSSGLTASGWKRDMVCFSRWRILLGGVLGALLLSVSAQANPLQLAEATPSLLVADEPNLFQPVKEGIYFYGEASEPDTVGAAYMVFEAQDALVVGAMFMPHSSFDCFQGQINDSELALQITDSYTQATHEYEIALVTAEEPIAAVSDAPVPLRLDGFFNLGQARDSELSILDTCKQNLLPEAELEI